MRKRLLLSLVAAVCCMSMWAQTAGPASNEIWYTSTGEAIDFSAIGKVEGNEKPDGKDYFVVTFESNVTEIPEDAFWEVESLTSITLPASVETIGNYAFEECTNLKSITFAEGSKLSTLGDEVFASSAITEIELPAAITSIPAFTFVGCEDLESVTFAGEITGIGQSAFNSCTSLSDFVIPATVTTIGEYAFNDAGAADGVLSFADGCKYTVIAEGPFQDMRFGTVILPEGMKEIKTSGFMGCSNLKSVIFPESLEIIGGFSFMGCTNLTSVTIPEGVTSIGSQAFFECESLETVTFAGESKLNSLGRDAFSVCPKLSFITIPAGVTSFGGTAFEESGAADGYLAFADGVTNIESYVFASSTCQSYVIPASVQSIGFAAYAYCTNMKEMIMLCSTPPTLAESGPFDSFDMWEDIPTDPKPVLVVPNGAADDYATAGWDAWFTIKEGEPLDVTEVGWASFYTDEALDIPSCAKVYYASAASGSTLTLTEITGTIPAGTAVIVQIPAGTLFPVSESTPEAITGNLLRGTSENIPRKEAVYVLSPASTKESPVFQNYTGDTLGAGKAYILASDLNGTESNTLRFVFGETTHIEAVSADTNADAPMYNLQGQRVSDDYRGIVIKNGRKVMIR